jgi:murein DD-endopeptidase MepM/ murein hydrolase activator NlpD
MAVLMSHAKLTRAHGGIKARRDLLSRSAGIVLIGGMTLLPLAGSPEAALNRRDAHTTRAQAPVLAWPVRAGTRAALGQGFGYLNFRATNSGYHTGIDIEGTRTAEVVAAGDGDVVLIQLMDDDGAPDCVSTRRPSGCSDHGYGNTVILKHESGLFTLYSHLSDISPVILKACGEVDETTERSDCSEGTGYSVRQGTVLGHVGGSGYGRANYWGTHLHFEVKGSSTLGSYADDASEFGYTILPPTSWGYRDPLLFVDPVVEVPRATVELARSATLLRGPGTSYRALWQVAAGSEFRVSHTAPASGRCISGWARVVPAQETTRVITDPRARRRGVLAGWLCAGALVEPPS